MMATMTTPPPVPTARTSRPRRRLGKVLLLAIGIPVGLLAALVVLAPYSLGLAAVRQSVAERLSKRLAAPVRIESMGWSWRNGVSVGGVEIGNPPGFPQDRPALRLKAARLDLSLSTLFGGRVRGDLDGEVDGLEAYVEQNADGQTNLQALAQHGGAGGSDGSNGGGTGKDRLRGLDRMRLDIALRDSRVEIRRDGQLLEALTELGGALRKDHGERQFALELQTKLLPLAGAEPGHLAVHAKADPTTGAADAGLELQSVDLHRFLPLVATFAPGKLETLAGIANGDVKLAWRGPDDLSVSGQLRVVDPVVGGPAFDGATLQAPEWHMSPAVTLAPGTGGAARRVTTDGFVVDLGFLQVTGLAPDAAVPALPDGSRPNFRWHLDTDGLGALMQRLPSWLQVRGGRWNGTANVPLDAVLATPQQATNLVRGQFELLVDHLAVAGAPLDGAAITGTMAGGKLDIATAPTMKLSGGGFTLTCNVDTNDLASLPCELSVRLDGGHLSGSAVALLAYAVPLLAGLDADTAQLAGLCDLELRLAGPARPGEGESWLALLNRWSGDGKVGLRQASVAPAGPLAGLLAPLGPVNQLLGAQASLGDTGRLAIDGFAAPFHFAAGAVETRAAKWLAKGKTIGLSGKARLDGGLDYAIDLSALLRGHKDGEKVLAALGGSLPAANLGGTLTAPSLGLPDLSNVAQKLLETELKQRGTDLLQRELEKLLKPKPR